MSQQKTFALAGIVLGLVGIFAPYITEGVFYFDVQTFAGVVFGYSAALLVQHEMGKDKAE